MSLARPVLVALLSLTSAAAASPPPRAARRATGTARVRPPLLVRDRVEYALTRFSPISVLHGEVVGVAGPIDPDQPQVDAIITASADTGWRYQIRLIGGGFETPARRLPRVRRLELAATLKSALVHNPALAEPLAYLLADLGKTQPSIDVPIDLDGFTIASADALSDGRGLRVRGFADTRLLEIVMALDGDGPLVRVRRWRPAGDRVAIARSRARDLAPGELEALEQVLRHHARQEAAASDPCGRAAALLHWQRVASAADH